MAGRVNAFAALLHGRMHGGAPRWYAALIALLATYLVVYHIYIGIYGAPTNALYLPVHLTVALALLFLVHPLGRRWNEKLRPASAVDLGCVAASFALLAYFLSIIDSWQMLYVAMPPFDFARGLLLIVLVFEAVRRTVGWSMIVVALAFCVHALFADRFPGILFGPPVRLESLVQTLVVGDTGVFGIPVLVVAQYVVLFLLFGRLLQATGAGTFFTRLAFAFFGHRVGGPAKSAVIASGLFGMLSGSGVSNVLTTGSFTIPMMRRVGYRGPFAGGVEASAAVGGSIMPPVMGAVAFMMAEFMGVDYAHIIIAAAIPALLYYLAIYWTVHFEARKSALAQLPKSALPDPWRLIARHGYLMIPLAMIAALLIIGYSIVLVAIVTSLGTFLLSFTSRATRLSPSRLAASVEATARVTCSLSATCACAGIIIGAIFSTGLTFQLSQAVLGLAGGRLWLILVIGALVSLVLGTGLTASAVYITMVATVIPILKASGVPDMASHMFAFYYGVVSDITPPTALAAVAAAGIARANPMTTMLEASRLGIAAFIVPIAFVFQPGLLMIGSPVAIATAAITAALGLIALSAALAGYLRTQLGPARRIVLAAAAACLIAPGPGVDVAGLVLFGGALLWDLVARRAAETVPARVALEEPETARASNGLFARWLARRIAREEEEAAEEMAAEAGGTAPSTSSPGPSLEAWLRDERITTEEAPADAARWSAWAVIAAAAVVLGYMGAHSWHATHPLLWLGVLAGLAVWLVGGLVFALRPIIGASAAPQEV
jgi:TRAP transporter 4TM/12TM fusion protein